MTRRLDHALGVLSALDSGHRVERPSGGAPVKKQKGSQFGTCTCNAQIIWSNLPSGARAPFDFNDAGDLCLVEGTMVEWSEALGTHKRRFSLHYSTCSERGQKG